MNILFLDAYFEPEQIAFTHLEHDLLEGLVNAGHEVYVVCPTPTRGVSKEVAEEYSKKKEEDLYGGHVHVRRFSAPQEGKNPILRAFRYFWCNLRTYQIGRKTKRIDAVFSNSTPPTQGLIAGKVAKKLKVPFIYSLQDVFPDSLVNTGMTTAGSLIWKIGRKIEDKTYRLAARIIVIGESIEKNLTKKGVSTEKVDVISNWIDLDAVQPIERAQNTLFDEYGIDRSKFVVVYAGNLGEAQGVEVVLEAAKLLSDHPDIQFVIFGGGARFQDISNRVKQEGIRNIFITGLQPQNRVSKVYSMGNVALITCKPGTGNAGMPSKTWSIMACNTPIVASFDRGSELESILNKAKTGICTDPLNANELAESIMAVKEQSISFGDPRSYVRENASKETCVRRYIDIIGQSSRR